MAIGKNAPNSNGPTEIPTTREGKFKAQIVAGAGGKYDPAEFIIPGQDGQGHSERVYCRVQPSLAMHIGKVKADKKFPFRTEGDIMRWSIWVGMKLLDIMEPTPNNFMVRAEAVNGILREETYNQEYMATLDSLQRVVQAYMQVGAVGEARRTVAKVKSQWEKLEEPYWKKRCLRDIQDRFGHLLKTEAPAGLMGGKEEDDNAE